MIVTVWVVVDRKNGDVSATARPMPHDRMAALEQAGCEIHEVAIDLDGDGFSKIAYALKVGAREQPRLSDSTPETE